MKHISMGDRILFETITIVEENIPYSKPFIASQLPYAKNHCGAVALANVLALNYHIEKNQQSLTDVYKNVGNGPVVFLSRIIAKKYPLLDYRYRRLTNVSSANVKENYYLVCMSLSIFEWHWFVVLDMIYNEGEDFLVVYDGWNTSVRYIQKKNMKCGFALEVKKALTK